MKNSDIIITGSSGLIGSYLTAHFMSLGRRVVQIDIGNPKPATGEFKVLDLRCHDDVNVMCELYADIPTLINCFGANDHVRPGEVRGTILDVDTDVFRDMLNDNVVALFNVCKQYAKVRMGRGCRIVNFGASTGIVSPRTDMYGGLHKHVGYSTSKAAVIHMTRILGTHLITLDPEMFINCISPGGIENGQGKDFMSRYSQHTPAHRMGSVADLVPAIEMLIDERNRYMVGENVVVDGGWCVQ